MSNCDNWKGMMWLSTLSQQLVINAIESYTSDPLIHCIESIDLVIFWIVYQWSMQSAIVSSLFDIAPIVHMRGCGKNASSDQIKFFHSLVVGVLKSSKFLVLNLYLVAISSALLQFFKLFLDKIVLFAFFSRNPYMSLRKSILFLWNFFLSLEKSYFFSQKIQFSPKIQFSWEIH